MKDWFFPSLCNLECRSTPLFEDLAGVKVKVANFTQNWIWVTYEGNYEGILKQLKKERTVGFDLNRPFLIDSAHPFWLR